MIRGEGNRNQTSEYITVFGKALPEASVYVRGRWDWTNAEAAKKWTEYQQAYTANRTNRALSRKRLLIRGIGPSLQLEFGSQDGKPFSVVGWTMLDSVDGVP